VQLSDELKASQKALAACRNDLALARAEALQGRAVPLGSAGSGAVLQLLVQRLDGVEASTLQVVAQQLQERLGVGAAVVLAGLPEPGDLSRVALVAAFGADVVAAGLKAGAFIAAVAKVCGGGGGGRPRSGGDA